MQRVNPKVFMVAETKINQEGLEDYLAEVNAMGWHTDAKSDSEKLTEFMGRLCYRSFKPGLNANVTKVREGNEKYMGNILNVGHGSVCEHASVSFVFHNVSRVFTHELVRHRVGVAISQESLRYVRLTDLGLWLPTCVEAHPKMAALFQETFENLEQLQLKMAEEFGLDDPEVDFNYKKQVTSAMRRIAPIGLATSVGWTTNHRNLRHVLQMRTSRHAEEEIRIVFAEVGKMCKEKWPNLYSDFSAEAVNGLPEYAAENQKI